MQEEPAATEAICYWHSGLGLISKFARILRQSLPLQLRSGQALSVADFARDKFIKAGC